MQKAYTKKRILELYLNQIYFRSKVTHSSSLEYFDKSVKVNYSEAAMLAALQKA